MNREENNSGSARSSHWVALIATSLLVVILTFAIVGSVSAQGVNIPPFFDDTTGIVHAPGLPVPGLGSFDAQFAVAQVGDEVFLDVIDAPPSVIEGSFGRIVIDNDETSFVLDKLTVGAESHSARLILGDDPSSTRFRLQDVEASVEPNRQQSWTINYSNDFPDDALTLDSTGAAILANQFMGTASFDPNGSGFIDFGASNFQPGPWAASATGLRAHISGTFDHFGQQGTFTATPSYNQEVLTIEHQLTTGARHQFEVSAEQQGVNLFGAYVDFDTVEFVNPNNPYVPVAAVSLINETPANGRIKTRVVLDNGNELNVSITLDGELVLSETINSTPNTDTFEIGPGINLSF